MTRLIDGFGTIASGYDLILCDVWGVLHNGVAAFGPACAAMVAARRAGASVVLVSNAPRPSEAVIPQLRGLGVPDEAWDRFVSSGDVARHEVARRGRAPCWLIGPERDLPLVEGLDLVRAPLESAAWVLCTGLFDDETETADDYDERLRVAAARRLPMVCANPDLVVERGHRLIPCAGALGAAHEALGGEVLYCGKPHAPIYDLALTVGAGLRGAAVPRERVLAIGDAIRTDIAGAAAHGLDSLLVLDGIHAGETVRAAGGFDESALALWLGRQGHRPVAAMPRLVW